MRRAIRLEGLDVDLEISKATATKTSKNFIYLDELPDGTWRIIWNSKMIPDFTKLTAMRVIRGEDADACPRCGRPNTGAWWLNPDPAASTAVCKECALSND